tara:strand:+ start:1640 stop:2323 length:684 start_codon:yes stop_codon:yes gene_type:complete
MKNYPKLGSGTKYDKTKKVGVYVDTSGFKFCLEDQLTISEFKELIPSVTIKKMADCHFCDREHVSIKLKKNGEPKKLQKAVIDGPDFIDDLVIFKGVDKSWSDNSAEWLYCIAFDDHIVKIGMTTTSLKKRYESYACGDRKARLEGTCSVTNFIVCEAVYAALLLGHRAEIFGIRVPKKTVTETFAGVTRNVTYSVVRDYEEILTDRFIEHTGHIPVLCVQKGDSTS